MEPETVRLIISCLAIFSTSFVGILGIYFTAKARSSAIRESLFTQQLELVRKIVYKKGRARVFFTVLADKDGTYEKQARDDVGEAVRDFSGLQEEGVAILPVELWVEIKRLNDVMLDMLVAYDECGEVTTEIMKIFVAHATKVALLSRAVLGIDELTTESLKLFSTEKNFKSLASLEIEHFKNMDEQINA